MKNEQVSHVVRGICDLGRREWPSRPVGAGLALVDRVPELSRDEFGVADLRREPEEGGGYLRIEQGAGHRAPGLQQHFQVLSRRMQDLQLRAVLQQLVQRREVEIGERIDQVAVGFRGELHQAQLCMVGALAHELGVEREPVGTAQPEDGSLEFIAVLDQPRFAHRVGHLRVESPLLRPPLQIVLHFLKAFLDIVLWRRGPQDLPASRMLLWLTAAAYVAVSTLQLMLLEEPVAAWLVFVVLDPVLLAAGVYLLLKLFGKTDRFLQTATAVLGTGVVLGLAMFLPVQWLLTASGVPAESTAAGLIALGMVVIFALVTGRILKLATDSNLFTGITLSLTYFLLINLLLQLASGRGG